jgi:predicted metal-binding membrane protein
VIWLGVLGVALLAWLYLWRLRSIMGDMDEAMPMAGVAAPAPMPWGAPELVFAIAMWAVMMVGMMLPSAAPLILLFAAVNRKWREQGAQAVPTIVFGLGYLVVWSGFSVAAALGQWALHATALLSPAMATRSSLLGGLLLLAAGVYQLTPLKTACLARCRSPLGWLLGEWREGVGGAFGMGLRHGGYCLGCCWILMGILFVTGVMNLIWVAAVTLFVLLEKVAPGGVVLGRVASAGLIVAGLLMLGRGAGLLAL